MSVEASAQHQDAMIRPLRAAQYVRASTDHQKYSTQNQSDTNHAYASCRGMEIVRTYTDEGRSGLSFEGREGLRQLIADVQSGAADFETVLCYDVSRWGRFQDADEAAHLEYLCKRSGIAVHYCAEQFANDGSLFAALIKNLKRVMAAEYSRELSAKVFAGHCRLVRLGYRQGGSAGYGLRRQLIDQYGAPKGFLPQGQWKSVTSDRVVLALGPQKQIAVVRAIFKAFVVGEKSTREIAHALNDRDVPNVTGRRWTRHCVDRILRNENYIGNLVWNKVSVKLHRKKISNPAEEWLRVKGALPAIVSRRLFDAAQIRLRERPPEPSPETRLAPLRRLFRRYGYLSAALINKAPGTPSASAYSRWFGSLIEAYKLVGYFSRKKHRACKGPPYGTTRSLSNVALLEGLRQVFLRHGGLSGEIIDQSTEIPCACTYRKRFGSLLRAYDMVGYSEKRRRPDLTSKAASRRLSDRELLKSLKRLKGQHGTLNYQIIESSSAVPCPATIRRRFGTLKQAYRLIGLSPGPRNTATARLVRQRRSDKELLDALRDLFRKHGYLSRAMINGTQSTAASNTYARRFGSLSRAYRLVGFDRYNRSTAWCEILARERRTRGTD